jgi:hypothetical protein
MLPTNTNPPIATCYWYHNITTVLQRERQTCVATRLCMHSIYNCNEVALMAFWGQEFRIVAR